MPVNLTTELSKNKQTTISPFYVIRQMLQKVSASCKVLNN